MQETTNKSIPTEEAAEELSRLICPECGKHTILWLYPTTEIKDLPVKCKRCGKEIIVNITPAVES